MLGLGLGVGKMNFFGGGISISANKCINTANEEAYSITFKNLEIGEAYFYNITDGTNNINDGFTATDKTEVIVEDLSSFDEGDVFITLTSSEGSVVKKVKKDTVSPAGYSLTLSNPFGFPKISTQAEIDFFDLEIGATVNWNIKDAPQDAVSGSFKATATTATVTTNVSSLVDGTLRAFCTLVDPCGNAGSEASSSPITKDTVVPSGYTIRIVENPINNQNEDNVELLFESLEVGATAFWSITDGVNTIADDFTITDTEESEFVDVSTFNNGTITATLVLVDDAGNQGVIVSDTSDKQVFTPSGYSVEFDAASYDETTGQNASISISGANIGNDYTLTITSSGGGTPIVYNGTVGAVNFDIDEIDLTTLNTGTGTATYFEEDSFGNVGGNATDTAEFVFASWQPIVATGGTIEDNVIGGITIRSHFITSLTDFVVTNAGTDGLVDLLMMPGGGGTLNSAAGDGGGGAGGKVEEYNIPVTVGNYSCVVGAGGNAANGSDSTALGFTALGGGGVIDKTGSSGGCGSGGSGLFVADGITSGGIGSQGFDGGTGFGAVVGLRSGGGGGGVSGNGGNAGSGSPGNGGVGLDLAAFKGGSSYLYGGGGGGGNNSVFGTATHGGGNGGDNTTPPQNGAANTGGGGGGSSSGNRVDTTGGSGFICIRYALTDPN